MHLRDLSSPLTITLGDGSTLQTAGRGNVILRMRLPHGKVEDCTLYDVLYVPGLAYNLLSVPAAARRSKERHFQDQAVRSKVAEEGLLPADTEKVAYTTLFVMVSRNKFTPLTTVKRPMEQFGIADSAISVSAVSNHFRSTAWSMV